MSKAIHSEFDRTYGDISTPEERSTLYNSASLIRKASRSGVALGGSTGLHMAFHKANKLPGDLDFITDDHAKAWDFLKEYYTGMDGYAHHGRMYIQNKTDWCPDGTVAHYHVESTIHMPFCIMVIKFGTLNSWYNRIGVCLQWSQDIFDAARKLTERDEKPRVEPFLDMLDQSDHEQQEREETVSLEFDDIVDNESNPLLDAMIEGGHPDIPVFNSDVPKRYRGDKS